MKYNLPNATALIPPKKMENDSLAVTIKTCCGLLSLSKSSVYEMIKSKQLDSFKVGRRRLITLASIKRLLPVDKNP